MHIYGVFVAVIGSKMRHCLTADCMHHKKVDSMCTERISQKSIQTLSKQDGKSSIFAKKCQSSI